MDNIRVFEAFSGYGSQRLACERYDVPHESVGISEIDVYAIQAYANLHEKEALQNFDASNFTESEMREELMKCNVGYDFKKKSSTIPRLSGNKLVKLYASHKVSNNFGDISLIDSKELPNMDLFTFSFPCTDLSVAGKQKGMIKGSGTSSSLIWECEKVIDTKRPKVLMMENVKALTFKKNMPLFKEWLNILESYGYKNYWKVINAKDCGVPQNRERVFCISIREDILIDDFQFLKNIPLSKNIESVLEENVDSKYYIDNENAKSLIRKIKDGKPGREPEFNGEALTTSALSSREHRGTGWSNISGTLCARDYKDPKVVCVDSTLCNPKELKVANCITARYDAGIQNKQSIGVAVIEKRVCEQRTDEGLRFFNDEICGTLRTIDSCGDKRVIEKCVRVGGLFDSDNNIHQAGSVYNKEGLCPTLDTMQGGHRQPSTLLNNYSIRKLTPRECFRLMGLQDSEIDLIQEVGISNSQQYKMAGNSIVVNCMEFYKNIPKCIR